MKKIILQILIVLVVTSIRFGDLCSQQKYEANWKSIDSRPVPKWFTDAKFGIFIHWGLYSVPAWCPTPPPGSNSGDGYAEWYWDRLMKDYHPGNKELVEFHKKQFGEEFTYQDFVEGFTCELFQPEDWATMFADAGAKYVVLTSKHHEGFTLWPSAYSWNWNAVDVGPHRDLAGEITNAVKNKGLHMGFYYSLLEWFNPLYKADLNKYIDNHMVPQMKELINLYTPDIVWTDGEWDYPSEKWRSTEFLAWLYNDSPVKETVVVNDRWGAETRNKHGGIYTTEYGLVHNGVERDVSIQHPWEENRGIGHSFGFNRNEKLESYSTSKELIHLLVEKVAMGGNLLLNVGPTSDGRIPVIMQQRLSDIGKWLKINGESIYETRNWRKAYCQPDISAYFTTKGKDLYVIFSKYPEKEVVIEGVSGKVSSVTMLGSDINIRYSDKGDKLSIVPPVFTPDNAPCEYAWVFKVSGGVD